MMDQFKQFTENKYVTQEQTKSTELQEPDLGQALTGCDRVKRVY